MRGDALVHTCHIGVSKPLRSLDDLFVHLDGTAMICGMPPDRSCDDHTLRLFQQASSVSRSRTLPCLSGFVIDDPKLAHYVAQRDREYPGLWRGLGESFARKERPGWTPSVRPDAPTVKLWDVAVERRMPVWLHHDLNDQADAAALSNVLKRSSVQRSVPAVVLCHAGVPKSGDALGALRLCGDLLGRSPLLRVELSWSAQEAAAVNPAPFREMIRRFSGQVMLGSDMVGDDLRTIQVAQGAFRDLLRPFRGTDKAERVCHRNLSALVEKE